MLVPVVDLKLTGQNIAVLRKKAGISVRELQDMLGFATPQAIYKWQRGETLPTVENLAALAYILGVAVEDILAVKCYQR
jgi:transcriptional regulator with XRE-family HTH domain